MKILDQSSRAEWLQQRREYVTATDIARLSTSAAEWQRVRDEKAGNAPELRMSAEMQWGVDREAALVRYAQTIDPSIEPNSLVCVHDDGPWAATPDGIGADVVAEVKTGSVSGLTAARKRHQAQMQWQLWVTGASGCLYVTEVRDQDEMGFSPGERTYEWVDRDENHIQALLDVAERFLNGDDTPALDVLIASVVDVQSELDKVTARLDEAKAALREHIGDRDFTHAGPFGRVSMTLPKPRIALDQKRLQAEKPDLYSEFTRESTPAKRTLRVSEGK